MVITLFSRDNVTINDLDNMCFSELRYWHDAHIAITAALKKLQEQNKTKSGRR